MLFRRDFLDARRGRAERVRLVQAGADSVTTWATYSRSRLRARPSQRLIPPQVQDAKDCRYFHHSFDDDQESLYGEKNGRSIARVREHVNRPVIIDNLEAELEEISDEEGEARRQAKEDYYNAQIGIGTARVQLEYRGSRSV